MSNDGDNDDTTGRPQARTGAVASQATDASDDDDADDLDANNTLGARPTPPNPTDGLTAAWAMRLRNSPADVAEFDRLGREALASVTPLELEVTRIEASLLEAIRQTLQPHLELAEQAEVCAQALQKELERAERSLRMALSGLQWSGPLDVCTGRMWQSIVAQGAAGTLEFRYYSPDPREGPQTVHPTRIQDIRLTRPAALWSGSPALDALARLARLVEIKAMGDALVPIPRDDTWFIDGLQLLRGRVFLPELGLLGDIDAHIAAGKPAGLTALDRMAASALQQVFAGVLERTPVPAIIDANVDTFARLIFPPANELAGNEGDQQTEDPPLDTARELFPAAMAENEGINLRCKPPKLPRYHEGGPYKPASKPQMDECITKLTALAGGTLSRPLLRSHGRHWLRHYRHADARDEDLEKRRMLPKYRSSRGTQGKLRPSI